MTDQAKNVHPANKAREFIMNALEALQQDTTILSKLENLTATLAKAQGKLFQAAKNDINNIETIEHIKKAMEYLAQGLGLMQDVKIESNALEVASKGIAQALSTLFPYSKIPEAAKKTEAKAEDQKPSGRVPLKTIRFNIDTQLGMDSDTHFYTGFSENISEGGIFVATFNLAPIGAKILVSFTLPDGYQVTARGLVKWMREYDPSQPDQVPGMGIKFTELLPKDKQAIEKFLKTRAPLFYDDEL